MQSLSAFSYFGARSIQISLQHLVGYLAIPESRIEELQEIQEYQEISDFATCSIQSMPLYPSEQAVVCHFGDHCQSSKTEIVDMNHEF